MTEEVTAFDLPVTGQVPADLNGRYLRNGPNPMGLEDPGYHWFIGDGMVHGVRLRDGRAEWYRNRWVRSQAVAKARGETWPAARCTRGWISRPTRTSSPTPAASWPRWSPGRCPTSSPLSWTPWGPCDFGGTLPGGFAAHTKADPGTGELHAIAYYWAWDHVQHVVVSPAGQVTAAVNIPLADGPMMHDFALTASYVVLFDLPVTFSMDAVSAGKKLPYTWNPATRPGSACCPAAAARPTSAGSTWTLLDLPHPQRLRRRLRPGGRRRVPLPGRLRRLRAGREGPLTLDRWIIDPAAGKVTQQRLDDRPQEFPRVSDQVVAGRTATATARSSAR